jgi:hypothetical protein
LARDGRIFGSDAVTDWNFNMDEAPKGEMRKVQRTIGKNTVEVDQFCRELIIAAMPTGTDVTVSYWVPGVERWNMFTKYAPPKAWKPWPVHPDAEAAE